MSAFAITEGALNANSASNADSAYRVKTKLVKMPTTLGKAKKQLKAAKKAAQKAEVDGKKAKAKVSAAKQRVANSQNYYDAALAAASAADEAARVAFGDVLANALRAREGAVAVHGQCLEKLKTAQQVAGSASSGVSQAQQDLDRAKAAYDAMGTAPDVVKAKLDLDEAKAALESAQKEAEAKQGNYDAAMLQVEQAENALADAEKKRDDAKAAADNADALATAAWNDYEGKKRVYASAENAYGKAIDAERDSGMALEAAKVTDEKAQKTLDDKKKALADAESSLKNLQDQKAAGAAPNKGTFDFFGFLGDQQAKDTLTSAKYASETKLGEQNDASHIDNVRCVFQFMEECNAIRKSLNLPELKVTSKMMAYAISNCNWSDTNNTLSGQFNVAENLAWGCEKTPYESGTASTSNPFCSWYDEEKKIWDAKKGSYSGVEGMDSSQIKQAYQDFYSQIKNYLNIVDPGFKVTGFAYNTVNKTFCQVFYSSTEVGEPTYSVSEYKNLYEEWYATLIDPDLDVKIANAEAAVKKAETEYKAAFDEAKKAKDAHDSAQTAYEHAQADSKKALVEKEAADRAKTAADLAWSYAQARSMEADKAHDDAQQVYSEAVSAAQKAKSTQAAAQDELTKAKGVFDQAKTDEAEAQKAYDTAANWHTNYPAVADAYSKAQASLAAAQSWASEAYAAFTAAQRDADNAQKNLDTAEDKLKRAEALTYKGIDTNEIADADFAHLGVFIAAVKNAHADVSVAFASLESAEATLRAKQAVYHQKQETCMSTLADVAFAKANYSKLKAKAKKAKK